MRRASASSLLFVMITILRTGLGFRPLLRTKLPPHIMRQLSDTVDIVDTTEYHVPVMKEECCKYLGIVPGGVYVDCTLGGGGHTKAILERGGKVIGIDQDPDAIRRSSSVLDGYIRSGQCEIIHTNFRDIQRAIRNSKLAGIDTANGGLVDGVLMDLGVSSFQINEGSRGFSIAQDGPLDMRMHKGNLGNTEWRGKTVISAHEIVNTWDTTAIADVLYNYGDEVRSRVLAREIVSARPLNTTGDLVRVLSSKTGFKERSKTLSRCFQALRIVVNDEIGALEQALHTMHECIRDNGTFVLMSYHSLEDRRVKQLFRTGTFDSISAEHTPPDHNPWTSAFKRAVCPSDAEVDLNRRARSAKLRAAERVPRQFLGAEEEQQRGKSRKNRNKDNLIGTHHMGAKQRAKLANRSFAGGGPEP